jgi:GntR family transcriptional regulator/MocR family aminotransferase
MHIDLCAAIEPGARGVRGKLISALRDAVRSGRLPAATKLPPSRSLAADLGIARNTVAEAYAALVGEGWLASRQGAGTWVVNSGPGATTPRPRRTPVVPRHNLWPASPDVSKFPRRAWLASSRRALANAPPEALRPGDPRGRHELREALAEYLCHARGVRTSAESIVICAGVRHAVQWLAQVLGRRGPFAVEAYGPLDFREAIAAMRVPTVPIGVDNRGAVVSEVDGTDAAAVLLTPAHQHPLGMALHPSRRTEVVDWALRTDGYVIDDDYDGEFRYDRQSISALQALRPSRVVYLGSAINSLAPALRVG